MSSRFSRGLRRFSDDSLLLLLPSPFRFVCFFASAICFGSRTRSHAISLFSIPIFRLPLY